MDAASKADNYCGREGPAISSCSASIDKMSVLQDIIKASERVDNIIFNCMLEYRVDNRIIHMF